MNVSPENDFLGFLSLGDGIRELKDRTEHLQAFDLNKMARAFFEIGWNAAKDGRWKTCMDAIKFARTLAPKKTRK